MGSTGSGPGEITLALSPRDARSVWHQQHPHDIPRRNARPWGPNARRAVRSGRLVHRAKCIALTALLRQRNLIHRPLHVRNVGD